MVGRRHPRWEFWWPFTTPPADGSLVNSHPVPLTVLSFFGLPWARHDLL